MNKTISTMSIAIAANKHATPILKPRDCLILITSLLLRCSERMLIYGDKNAKLLDEALLSINEYNNFSLLAEKKQELIMDILKK